MNINKILNMFIYFFILLLLATLIFKVYEFRHDELVIEILSTDSIESTNIKDTTFTLIDDGEVLIQESYAGEIVRDRSTLRIKLPNDKVLQSLDFEMEYQIPANKYDIYVSARHEGSNLSTKSTPIHLESNLFSVYDRSYLFDDGSRIWSKEPLEEDFDTLNDLLISAESTFADPNLVNLGSYEVDQDYSQYYDSENEPYTFVDFSVRGAHEFAYLNTEGEVSVAFDIFDIPSRSVNSNANKYVNAEIRDKYGNILYSEEFERLQLESSRFSFSRELPQGLYFVTLDTVNESQLLKNIEFDTNYVGFYERLYLGNATIYEPDLDQVGDSVYVTGENLASLTYHNESLQYIEIGNDTCAITERVEVFNCDLDAPDEGIEVTVPKGNMLMNADGLFFVDQDSVFEPYTIAYTKPYNTSVNFQDIEYLIGDFNQPDCDGDICTARFSYVLDYPVQTTNDFYLDLYIDVDNLEVNRDIMRVLDISINYNE